MVSRANDLIKISLFSLIAIIFIASLAAISGIVKLVIVSALLAYILDPVANFLESRGMSRTSATTTIFLAILVLIGVAYILFLPLMSGEIKALQGGFNPEKAGLVVSRLEDFLVGNLAFLGIRDLSLLSRTQAAMARMGDWFFTHILDAASVITSVILIPFIVFFLMKDGREFKKSFVSIMPNRYFEFSLYLLHNLNVQFGNYLRGQLMDAAIVGTLAIFALWLIGVKFFFIIGVFGGLANLVPYFGPIVGAIIAVMVSVLQTGSFHMASYVVIAFTLIKLIDDAIVQPTVVARSVHMNPLTVLLAVLVGGKLFGMLGMLLSVPVAGFIKVVAHESILNYRRYRNTTG
jgi:predicted PurR-regulated permease PerM